MELNIQYIDTEKVRLNKNKIKKLTESIFEDEEKIPGIISIILTNDEYLLDINKKFLNHNYYTDVITFNEIKKNKIDGNILISIDRIVENSSNFSDGNILNELHRVIIHGMLHLTGYNDYTIQEKSIITQKENFYLNKLSLQV